MQVPQYSELMIPTIKAIEKLGGSGTNHEIAEEVIQALELPDEIISQLHNPEKSSQTEVEYRLAWARTYLKKVGLVTNSERSVWSFTEKYQWGMDLDPDEIVQQVRSLHREARAQQDPESPDNSSEFDDWRSKTHQLVLSLDPSAFERLAKRLLREIGFVQVEVTGQSGDGGIDGKGIVKIQDVLSYHVVFQCKRYNGTVGPAAIRDFRGAMIGRADKGLFITTGTFTRDASREAIRDGAPPIDLIDGDELVELLKKLRLGIEVKMVENVEVDCGWFESI